MRLLAIFACLLWGSAVVGAKIGFEYVPPILLSGIRFSLAGLLLLPLLIYRREPFGKTLKEHWVFMSLFAFMQTFFQYGLFFMGLDKVPGAIGAIVVGAGPLVITVMAHFFMPDDRITFRKMIAILLSLLGVVFISATKGGTIGVDDSEFYLGLTFLLVSILIGGYTNIAVAKYKKSLSPVFLTAYANFFGGLALTLAGLLVEEVPNVQELPLRFYAAWVWLAIIPAAGFSIWYSLLQRPGVKVSDLNMWKFVIPVTGCLFSWAFLPGEYPTVISVAGVLIITVSLQINQMPASAAVKIAQLFKRKK